MASRNPGRGSVTRAGVPAVSTLAAAMADELLRRLAEHNPYHDPKTGKFTTKDGAGGGAGGLQNPRAGGGQGVQGYSWSIGKQYEDEDAATAACRAACMGLTRERAYMVEASGMVRLAVEGDETSVDLGSVADIRPYHVVHNHPSGTAALSGADASLVLAYGARGIEAVTPDGTRVSLTTDGGGRTAITPESLSVAMTRASLETRASFAIHLAAVGIKDGGAVEGGYGKIDSAYRKLTHELAVALMLRAARAEPMAGYPPIRFEYRVTQPDGTVSMRYNQDSVDAAIRSMYDTQRDTQKMLALMGFPTPAQAPDGRGLWR